jgi:hypothetical protein
MAILFEMWVECADESACRSIAAHFDGYQFTLHNGRIVTWEATVVGPPSFAVGVVVLSDVLSRYGVRSLQDAIETTESALRLYHHLKIAPDFRFARVDWDAENIPLAELSDYVATARNGQHRLTIECVLDEALYDQLGRPAFCYPFRDGYWWTRYRGEEYHPLYSNDQPQLNEFCRAIFPEYFSL